MKTADKSKILLDRMAAHVLEHGLGGASLRPLAKAAGTSDRMLIYHFGSKERLVESLLVHIAENLKRELNDNLPQRRAATRAQCAAEILELMKREEIAPFARLWFDILSGAQSGDPVKKRLGGEIMSSFHAWLMDRLPDGEADPARTAWALLALIEGIVVLNAAGHGEAALGAAALLLGEAPAP